MYNASLSENNRDYCIILNKYGCIMSFFLLKLVISWSSIPFADGKFSYIIIDIHKNICFCFYDEQLIEIDYKKIHSELNKSEHEFSKIPFSKDFFIDYFNKLTFNNKIDLYSIINRKRYKRPFGSIFRNLIGV